MSMNSFHSRSHRAAPAKAQQEAPAAPRKGVRADVLAVEQGLAASRSLARDLILGGWVAGPAGRVTKPSQELPPGSRLRLLAEAERS